MEQEINSAIDTINKVIKTLKEEWASKSSEVAQLENQEKSLKGTIKGLESEITKLKVERGDLQFFLDSKKKEDEIKTLAIKQASEEIARRETILEDREKNLDMREIRIRDRESMRGM